MPALEALGQGRKAGGAAYPGLLLKTVQTVQKDSELDDGYYEKGLARSYTVNTTGAQSGTSNVDLTHLVSDTGAFTSADKTYTDAGKCGVFKATGGETIIIIGSASNNGTFTTSSATANTVVFVEAIADEADAPATTFKKRDAVSNNTVLDNNTGLEWNRYVTTKMGIAGDGLMPYTGVTYDIYAYCAAANAASLGGHTDWRVSNMLEILSLLMFTEVAANSVDATAFPSLPASAAAYYWSSTTRTADDTRALTLSFYYRTNTYALKTVAYRCMLVRGG